MAKWQVGDKILNRLEIIEILGGPGKSGMGIVYLCYDCVQQTPVVLKTLQDRFLEDKSYRDQFINEAEVWVKLGKHRNIVNAYGVQEIEGRPFILLEFVYWDKTYGPDLSGWIHQRRLELPLSIDFAIQFCNGMIYLSKQFEKRGTTLVHRDIKPSNILVTQDKVVKITDFGLAKVFGESLVDFGVGDVKEDCQNLFSLCRFGGICGTPAYMSPEQCRGEKNLDARSDIYSFGCVLYEMLTGSYVFDAKTPKEFIHRHLNTKPSSLPPGIPEEIARVVNRCLEKDPVQRYENFSELRAELSEAYRHLTGSAVQTDTETQDTLNPYILLSQGMALKSIVFMHRFSSQSLRVCNDAIGVLKEYLSLDPNNHAVRRDLGILYFVQRKIDLAIYELETAIKLSPHSEEYHNVLGVFYHKLKKFDSAAHEFNELLEINPESAEARYGLGKAYFKQGKLEDALSEMKEAIKLNPKFEKAHNKLGQIYFAQGKFEPAKEVYIGLLEMNPTNTNAYIGLGFLSAAQGRTAWALADYEEALKIDSAIFNKFASIAQGHESRVIEAGLHDPQNWRELEIVLAIYLKLFQKNPSDKKNLKKLIRIRLLYAYKPPTWDETLDNAASLYREMYNSEPQNAEYCLRIAQIYNLKAGYEDFSLGNEWLKKALELNPNSSEAHLESACYFETRQEQEKALAEVNLSIKLDPDNADAYATRARLNLKRDLALAIQDYVICLQKDPEHFFARAMVTVLQKRVASA